MDWHEYIDRNPEIMLGKPVFKGTRLTVQTVLEQLGAGASEQQILAAYPRITPNHIRAAHTYAAAALSADEMIVIE